MPKSGIGLLRRLWLRHCGRRVCARYVERVRVRGLDSRVEADPVHPADKRDDYLAPDGPNDACRLQPANRLPHGFDAAAGGLGDGVIGREACAVAMAVEAP